jgi:hypothetical protein
MVSQLGNVITSCVSWPRSQAWRLKSLRGTHHEYSFWEVPRRQEGAVGDAGVKRVQNQRTREILR